MTIIHHEPETGKFPTNNLWVFYGSPKTGKSSFAAQWDHPLAFDLESGYGNIEADIIIPKSYQEFLKELHNPKNLKPYNTIIIDTIDIIYEWIEKTTIDALNRSFKTSYDSISEFPHGTGWSVARMNTKKFIFNDLFNITRMNKNVVIIAHEKAITITRNGKDETAFKLALPGQTSSTVASLADVVGRVYSKSIAGRLEPRISFAPGQDDGGSRIKSLANKEISLSFETLKSVIENPKTKSKSKKLTDIAKAKPDEDDDDDW
jgi:hypothetical protein